jgi:hypothetical protein
MEWVVDLHSIWRWVVLIAAVIAIVLAALAMMGTRPWDSLADRFSFFFTVALDLQVLIGLVIWIFNQAWTRDAFIAFIHPVLMLAAVAVAHIGRTRSEHAKDDRSRGRTALTFFVVSVIVIIVAIPTAAWPI